MYFCLFCGRIFTYTLYNDNSHFLPESGPGFCLIVFTGSAFTLISMSVFDLSTIISKFHLPEPPYLLALTISVSLSTLSEWLNFRPGSVICKFIASVTLLGAGQKAYSKFDLLGLESLLSQENRFALFFIPGLTLSCFGDILLVHPKTNDDKTSKHKTENAHSRLKYAKILSSLAHVAYISAFVLSVDVSSKEDFRRADFVMTMVFGALLADWLGLFQRERQYNSWFEIPKAFEWPVFFYNSLAITMVATATATDKGYQRIAGAWLLMLSDLFVVSNAFGVEEIDSKKKDACKTRRLEWMTTSFGWIFYYISQLLLAGCM